MNNKYCLTNWKCKFACLLGVSVKTLSIVVCDRNVLTEFGQNWNSACTICVFYQMLLSVTNLRITTMVKTWEHLTWVSAWCWN